MFDLKLLVHYYSPFSFMLLTFLENSRSILLSSDLLFILFSLSILLSLESTEILSRILFINNINNNIQKEDEKINTKKQMTEKEKEKNFCDNIIMKMFEIVQYHYITEKYIQKISTDPPTQIQHLLKI